MKQHSINYLNNFIGGWYLDDTSICDVILQYHKNSPLKVDGCVWSNNGREVNKAIKDSIDITLDESPHYIEYVTQLQTCVDNYIEKYKWSNMYAPWGIIEPISVQTYPFGGGYHSWHTERFSANNNRHLAFITYLNDITDAGETEFYHQDVKIKPEKGLTVIFPTDWTFTHRGIASNTQEKTVVTGWFSYMMRV